VSLGFALASLAQEDLFTASKPILLGLSFILCVLVVTNVIFFDRENGPDHLKVTTTTVADDETAGPPPPPN
jgi:hypothetical protein